MWHQAGASGGTAFSGRFASNTSAAQLLWKVGLSSRQLRTGGRRPDGCEPLVKLVRAEITGGRRVSQQVNDVFTVGIPDAGMRVARHRRRRNGLP